MLDDFVQWVTLFAMIGWSCVTSSTVELFVPVTHVCGALSVEGIRVLSLTEPAMIV